MAQVYFSPDDDPKMRRANKRARASFRFFWRELSWEYRRIVPGLDLACVKVPFSDPPEMSNDDDPGVEQMWVSDIMFDGKTISGTLLNSPNWLKSISEGDSVETPLKGISDWMYVINGRVYGAYTVNVLREGMSRGERAEHDAAWGLDFGDPNYIEVVPMEWFRQKKGFLQKLFGGGASDEPIDLDATEHPMAANMAESFEEFLTDDPSNVHSTDERGLTMLHQQTLAGSPTGVSILLKHGADPNAIDGNGSTPLKLANTLGWKHVAEVLMAHGAK